MSRIGKQKIHLEKGIEVSLISDRMVLVKSGEKSLHVPFFEGLELQQKEDKVFILRKNDQHQVRALHGLTRALIQNAVTGLLKGWSKTLELHGVGYRANLSGKKLELSLGYSHPIVYDIPDGIEVKVEKQTKISIHGIDKALVGLVADQIRSYRPVEPYLGKGVRYSDERIRRKAGKSGGEKK